MVDHGVGKCLNMIFRLVQAHDRQEMLKIEEQPREIPRSFFYSEVSNIFQ